MVGSKNWTIRGITAATLLLAVSASAVESAPRAKAKPKVVAVSKVYKATITRQTQAADKLMALGKYAEAAELYHEALNLDPKDVPTRVGYGMACVRQFQLDRAGEEFDLR